MRNLVKIMSLILLTALLFSLSSCAKIEQFFGSEKPTDGDDHKDQNSLIGEIDPRVPGVYNFLLVREGKTAGNAETFTLAQMSLDDDSISMFHIPENLFVNYENAKSLGEIYEDEYARVLSLGMASDECEIAGAKAVSACLNANLALPIDYHIVMNKDAVKDYVDLLGGVEMSLPFAFTTDAGNTYPAGVRKLDGEAIVDFLGYDAFENTKSKLNAMSEFLAGIHKKITATLSAENISVHMVQAKPLMSTDLPTKDGYDIFFLRKLISIKPDAWKVSTLCTYPVSTSAGSFEVVRYTTALEQINTFLKVYLDPIKSNSEQISESDKVFDKDALLTDTAQPILNNIYKSQTTLPNVHTADDIYTGKLEISQK